MKIDGGKQILFPGVKPSLFIQALAFGTMTVAAGVVGDPQATTMITLIHMAPKLGGAANLNSPHGTQMPQRHLVGLPVGLSIGPKDIGHFKTALHQKPSFMKQAPDFLLKYQWDSLSSRYLCP
jgi:hypothetical protein